MRAHARGRDDHEDVSAAVGAHGPVGSQPRVPAVGDGAGKQTVHAIDAAPLIAALQHAGIPTLPFPPTDTITQAQIQQLIARLTGGAPSLAAYGPRIALLHILQRTGDTTLAALNARLAVLQDLTVMRPDGYMVRAWDGAAIELFGGGRAQDRNGRMMFDQFAAGGIYLNRSNIYYRTNDALAQASGPIGEGGLQHDLPNRVLDGAAAAMGSIVHGIEQLIRDPIRSLSGLAQLPGAVAALLRASPQLWERFRTMPVGDQVQLISRITTELLLLYGSVEGTTTQLNGGLGALAADAQGLRQLMTLRLAPTGELVRGIAAVRPGQVATMLGGGPGAVWILHMANTEAGGGGGNNNNNNSGGSSSSQPTGAAGEPAAAESSAAASRELPPPPPGAAPPDNLAQIMADAPPGARAVYPVELGGAGEMTLLRAWMRLEGTRLHVHISNFQGRMNAFTGIGAMRALARRFGASSLEIEGELFQAAEADGGATRIQRLVEGLRRLGYRVEREGERARIFIDQL